MNKDVSKKRKPMGKILGNLRRFMGIVNKFLKSSYRDKPMYFWVFGYPLLFMLIYYFAFSGTSRPTYTIAIINYDSLAMEGQAENEIIDFSSIFIINLFNPENSDCNLSETFLLRTDLTETEGIRAIQADTIDALIIFPKNFSEIIHGAIEGDNPSIIIYTSPDPMEKAIIPNIFNGIINDLVLAYNNIEELSIIHFTTGEVFSIFDYMMPGLIIAGITVSIMNVATLFAREMEKGLMERLDTTPVPRSVQLLGGGTAQIIFSTVQGLILMLCLLLFGVQVAGNADWIAAFVNVIVTAYMCIGCGLIIAALVRNADSAGGMAWIIILPFQFFGNLVMSFGDTLFNRIFPTYYAGRAMRNVLIDGFGLIEILPDLLTIFIFGTVFILIALLLFKKRRKL